MRIGPRKLWAGTLVLLLTGALAVAWAVGWIHFVDAALLFGMICIWLGLAWLDIRQRRLLVHTRDQVRSTARRGRATSRTLTDLQATLATMQERLSRIETAVEEVASGSRRTGKFRTAGDAVVRADEAAEQNATRQLLDQATQIILARLARTERAVDDVGAQVSQEHRATTDALLAAQQRLSQQDLVLTQATIGLQDALGSYPLPPTTGWTAFADLLSYLYRLTLSIEPKRIVECGSGVSSVVLAAALERLGGDRLLLTLEHDPGFAARTRWLLEERSLTSWAQVVDAPLESMDDSDGATWYQTAGLPDDEPIDLLFVDGPPGSTGPFARLPAVPMLKKKFSPGCVVVLDDTNREEERKIVERWAKLLPHYHIEYLPHSKGTDVLFDPKFKPQPRWID